MVVALLVVFLLMGASEIYIDGAPTPAERIVLAVIALVIPLAAVVGWAVSRLHSLRVQSIVSIAAVLVASGAGAVLGWAVRLTMTQVAAIGALFVRALPVML